MGLARYKDLCIDAVDAERLGAFWGAALRLEPHPKEGGVVRLTGPTPQHTVWVNEVPEPVTVKQRVHLDLHVDSVADILALGATVEDTESFPWQVLRDPEAGELCTFERDVVPANRLYEIIVDCADPDPIARWWATLLGGHVGHVEQYGVAYVDDIAGAPFENLVFVPVPEPKTVKNRIHIDLVCPDLDAVVDHGARVLRPRGDAPGDVDWTVLADPDGNEFCAFLPAAE